LLVANAAAPKIQYYLAKSSEIRGNNHVLVVLCEDKVENWKE